MVRLSVKNMWAHKRRLFGTVFAVVLGVAFLAGTLVLGDTMRSGIDHQFTEVNAGIDAMVRSSAKVGSEETATRGLVETSLVDDVARVAGVETVVPHVDARGQLVGSDGDPIGGHGPPTEAGNWITEPRINPWNLVQGRAPNGPGEMVINQTAADDGDLHVGETTTILTPAPVSARIVGIVRLGDDDATGGATFAGFTLPEAQRLFMPSPNEVSDLIVTADPGVGEDELAARVHTTLPAGTEAVTGHQLTEEDKQALNGDFLDFFEKLLLVFAGIALLVGTFSIYNTFTILIAQRTRESALLRAIGASRAQVLRAMAGEALAIGAVASAVGLGVGIALASGLLALMDAAGFGVPSAALAVNGSTVAWSFAAGLLVTALASCGPALRGARVAPIEALRDVARERSAVSTTRVVVGALLGALGTVLVVVGAVGHGGIGISGLGALSTMLGFVVFGPVVARPAAGALGAPLPMFRRMSGKLARQNAIRNPRRTAATASALMVGIGVVTVFTVLAASVKVAIDDTVRRQFGGDLVLNSDDFSAAGMSPQLASDIGELPEVALSSGLGIGTMTIDRQESDVSIVDPPTFARLLDVGVTKGSIANLDDHEIAVSKDEVVARHWRLGQRVTGTFAPDGASEPFTIGALYDSTDLVGDYVVPAGAWIPHAAQPSDIVVMIGLADGVSIARGKAAVQRVADEYFAPDVQTRQEYVDSVASEVDQFLTIVYALLILAIIIALMGIANTLSLSVYERTRELGLLRAVGQTRSQLRSMVRWESVIVAVFGTLGGVLLGMFLGWGLLEVTAASENLPSTYTVPLVQLAAVLFVGALVGVLAGWRPARRAARLDVLRAVASE
jgi:putative ABC transport system permease protein